MWWADVITIGIPIVIIVIDIILYLIGGRPMTISGRIKVYTETRPWLPMVLCFIAGLLAGHWFW